MIRYYERTQRKRLDWPLLFTYMCVSIAKKIGIALLLSTALPVSMLRAENKRENPTHLTQSSTTGKTNLSQDTLKSSCISQQIDSTELMKVKDANFVNSLIGRLAGATTHPGASGVGAARMVLRGYRSILKSNNVLFTLDGVPLPRVALSHELRHSYDADTGSVTLEKTENGIDIMEVRAVNTENKIRMKTGDSRRKSYGGKEIPKKYLE